MTRNVLTALFLAFFALIPLKAALAIETTAKQAIVIDYDTGRVLLEKNADERMPTSSMSKVMTIYLIFDALKSGHMQLNQQLPVSEKAWRMQGSKMFVMVGKSVTVEDLIQGVVVQSGNDATIVLAEGLAGSEEAFAEMMNKKAAELGMVNSHFMNASGWPDPEHYSTARDLSILAKAMVKNFPDYYKYYSEKEFTYNNIKQGNRNPLLYKNIGADGMKTGHTEGAGYGLIGTGVYDGRRVILVVNGLETDKARAAEGANLLEWGMKNFENRTLIKAGQSVEKVRVALGQQENVPMIAKDDLFLTLPRTSASNYKITAHYKEPLIAPVKQGEEIGSLMIEVPHSDTLNIPLYAGRDVEKLGFFSGALIKSMMLVSGH
jgi:D-alanyl-D-alanine carboxypeptidase (penicillin-binding protein 5/6)